MTLLKTIHQWDINTEENLAAFKRESLEILQKVDRAVYIRTLITDAECLLNPYCDREEFINWITQEFINWITEEVEEYRKVVIVEGTLIHRNGKPVRAEFRQEYGPFLDSLRDPNAGGVIDVWGPNHEFEGPCYLVEDEDGIVHRDYKLFAEHKRRTSRRLSRYTMPGNSPWRTRTG